MLLRWLLCSEGLSPLHLLWESHPFCQNRLSCPPIHEKWPESARRGACVWLSVDLWYFSCWEVFLEQVDSIQRWMIDFGSAKAKANWIDKMIIPLQTCSFSIVYMIWPFLQHGFWLILCSLNHLKWNMGVIEKRTGIHLPRDWILDVFPSSVGNFRGWSHFFQRLAEKLPGITGGKL